ncbi:hypothetical protein [uncultured Erythrobacter sp.]|uniref:hypothetical protein n=1 Tax=uncultured Erythrobacter sp. TaxID=263913 RepID=UPI0026108E1F|nr:hypothetical protein [uncultured Erythrobacter sp.]
MTNPNPIPYNVEASAKADEYLSMLERDVLQKRITRESAFDRDARPLGIVANFEADVAKLTAGSPRSVNDYATLASFYRDVRVHASEYDLSKLFKYAYFKEHHFRALMLQVSSRRRDLMPALGMFFWGITSKFGTSLSRWLLFGVTLVALFSICLFAITDQYSLAHALLLSAETFSQADYPIDKVENGVRVLLFCARVVGMIYIAFGFGLLLPVLTLELSRTTLATSPVANHHSE